MKLVFVITFAALVWGQSDGTKPEIRGLVIEPGIERGVADADIAIFDETKQAGKVTTDGQGKFLFHPERFGIYRVVASKEGYGGETTSISVTLSADHPSREARFQLARTGEIAGRVVDEETGGPLVNFRIEAASFYYRGGQPQTGSPTLANTDEDGRFIVNDLVPGRYVVIARPRTRVSQSSESDLPSDYEISYWPGGRQLDLTAPITLISGGSADVGVMKLRKVALHSVSVAISEANCTAGESVQISFLNVSSQFPVPTGTGDGSCGETSLLRNFRPGSYGLILTQGTPPERSMASVRFDIVDKDVDLAASLVRDVEIDSRLVSAEGTKIPFEKLGLWVADVTRIGPQPGEQLGPPRALPANSEGRFELFSRAPFGKFSISLITPTGPSFSINRSYYIKEMRFNGELVADNLVALTGSPARQSLEIVVDDQPATVTGVVNDGDRPASKPDVLLIEWPLPAELAFGSPQGTSGDDDGQFRLTGLAPGEYRAIAVSRTNRDILNEPGVLQRVLRGAETIKLTRGGLQSLTLKLTDPSR